MAVTAPSDVFSPAIVAQLAYEQAFARIALLSSGYIRDARTSATRQAGNKIAFPYTQDTNITGKAQTNPRNGVAVTPDSIKIAYEEADIVPKIVSFENDAQSLRNMANMADPNQYMANLYQAYMAETIESALITSAVTTTLSFAGHSEGNGYCKISTLKKAIAQRWGAKAKGQVPLILLNPAAAFDLETSTEVVNKAVYQAEGATFGTPILELGGFRYMQSDLLPTSGSGATKQYTGLIVLPDAVDLWFDTEGEGYGEQRKPGTTAYVSDFWFNYVTNLVHANPERVIKFTTYSSFDAA